jgi:phage head maturation protease
MSTITETFDPTVEQTRTFHARAEVAAPEKREISGVGVPLEERIQIYPGLYEEFAQDCNFEDIDRAKLRIDHGTLAGVVAKHARSTGKLNITVRASKVSAGDDALVLASDGALDSFSIGFRSKDYDQIDNEDGSVTIRHTRVQVREFSLTATPYYPNASVTEVRSITDRKKENTMGATATTTEDTALDELRSDFTARFDQIEEGQRSLRALVDRGDEAPTTDLRSAGALLKAIVAGDEEAIKVYNRAQEHINDEIQFRAYTGGTTADAPVKDAWVGDLTRIFDSSSGALANFFGSDVLPKTGMNVEYAQLLADTTQVNEQAAEGDDLAFGKVTLENKTAPVKTYGGYTQLTRQQIERSTLPVLNHSLRALTIAAAKRRKAVLRTAVGSVLTARKAIASNGGVVVLGATLAAGTADNWENALIDAAIRYDAEAMEMQRLFVSATVFKKLRSLTVSGERVFKVAQDNASGVLDLPGLRGDFAGVPVTLDAGQTGDEAYFANKAAITQYLSALYSLSDENIINLSKDFSVYFYGAVAAEIPQLIVPVKLAAS